MKAHAILSKGIEFKCGGCNWNAETAWYLEGEPEPELEEAEGEEDRLKNGLCTHCFAELLGSDYKVVPK